MVVFSPNIGEIRRASEIGKKDSWKYIWQACSDCGKERWVTMNKNTPTAIRCFPCARLKIRGANNPQWKGGRYKARGYILIKINREDFFYSMARVRHNHSFGYVLEHRLIMARHLGRNLQSWEIVHHKNGITDDNRRENLELAVIGQHIRQHSKGYKAGYEKGLTDGRLKQIEELKLQNEELLKRIKLLQWHFINSQNKEQVNGGYLA